MKPNYENVENVTLSEILGLDTWNQPRTSEDLQAFIENKHQGVAAIELDDLE